VLLAGAGAEVGGEPTATADATAGEAGRWGRDGTLSGTLEGHYRTDRIVRDDDIADEVWERPSSVECHALLQLSGEANYEAVLFLIICVHLVQHILRQTVEHLQIVMHGSSTLL
jgi:hypothetical protein